jgi:hypothetical protein
VARETGELDRRWCPRVHLAKVPYRGVEIYRLPRKDYQIYRVDHRRNQELMVAEVEGLHEAEKPLENYLRNMSASERRDEISYYRSTFSRGVPKMFGLSRAG